jgi:hypothetical protein
MKDHSCPNTLSREIDSTSRRGPRPDEVAKWKRMQKIESEKEKWTSEPIKVSSTLKSEGMAN